jgi:hypothetical protein
LYPTASNRTKEAAEELQKEQLQQLKNQAAAATSSLGERVQQAASNAQQLAKDTVDELKKQNSPGGAAGSTAGGGSAGSAEGQPQPPPGSAEQQQQQQQRDGAGEQQGGGGAAPGGDGQQPGAEAGTKQKAAPPSVAQRLKSFASAAAQEIIRTVQSEQTVASALRGSSAKASNVQTASTDALAVSKQQQSAWQRQYEEMRGKVRRGRAGLGGQGGTRGEAEGSKAQGAHGQGRRTVLGPGFGGAFQLCPSYLPQAEGSVWPWLCAYAAHVQRHIGASSFAALSS